MAGFPRDRRWFTRDTTLLIHGRRMLCNVHPEGPLGSYRRVLEEIIADIDNGLRVEDDGFAELIVGSTISLDDIRRKAYGGWYLSAVRRWNSTWLQAWFKPARRIDIDEGEVRSNVISVAPSAIGAGTEIGGATP
jgi:hypothetical protein